MVRFRRVVNTHAHRSGRRVTLQSRVGQRWEHNYRVIPYPRYEAEYEVANWYRATYPDAPNLTNIIAARPRLGGSRVTMFNAQMVVRDASALIKSC